MTAHPQVPRISDDPSGASGSREQVVWPRGKKYVQMADLARRLPTLAGKRIGFLWDYVFRGDEVFPILEQELTRRFPGIRFVPYQAFGATFGGEERQTMQRLAANLRQHQVDAVVSGMGC